MASRLRRRCSALAAVHLEELGQREPHRGRQLLDLPPELLVLQILSQGRAQLALLWTSEKLDSNSLPMGIAEIEFACGDEITRCQLTGIRAKGSKAKSDASLVDARGEAAVILRGMETIAIPAGS